MTAGIRNTLLLFFGLMQSNCKSSTKLQTTDEPTAYLFEFKLSEFIYLKTPCNFQTLHTVQINTNILIERVQSLAGSHIINDKRKDVAIGLWQYAFPIEEFGTKHTQISLWDS